MDVGDSSWWNISQNETKEGVKMLDNVPCNTILVS